MTSCVVTGVETGWEVVAGCEGGWLELAGWLEEAGVEAGSVVGAALVEAEGGLACEYGIGGVKGS